MAEKKMTKKEMYAQLKAKYDLTEDEIKFIDHEVELLEKKNSGTKKPTATQKANEGIKAEIVGYLEGVDGGKTITEIQKGVDVCADLSNQKVSALVRQLVEAGTVVKTVDKRKSYFSVA